MTDDDYGADSIHPPNVVLVNSNQTSPDHQPSNCLCSPLSTAPNSPFRVSYEEDDDDETDEGMEIRPEEIQAVLDTPVSAKHLGRVKSAMGEVPFDEGRGGQQSAPIDPLLGNPRLKKKKKSASPAPLVTPMAMAMDIHEDIDAYEEEEDEEDPEDDSDEKKEEIPPSPPPPRPPMYAGYSASKLPAAHYPRAVPKTASEDDSVPMDERQFRTSSSSEPPNSDFIETARDNAEHNEDQSPMKEALQTAEREVQEMERRVQQIIAKRSNSGSSHQRFVLEEKVEPNNKSQSTTDEAETDLDRLLDSYDIEGEPPSLSPRRDVHSSLDSGGSSYYYDGSAMGSSTTDDANNTTLESTNSSTPGEIRVGMSIHPPLEAERKASGSNYYSRLMESSRGACPMESSNPCPMERSREEAGSYPRCQSSSFSNNKRDSNSSSPYEPFASRLDQEATTASFAADWMSGTSRAINQVTDDLANFLVLPQSEPQSGSKRRQRSKKYNPPPQQAYPPISPSQDSDGTPHMDNLSPRRKVENDVDIDLMYRQRPSAKLAKARSLVSGRNTKSPTTAPYIQGSNNNRGMDDPKQKARQVMDKRERERPPSISRRSSSDRDTSQGSQRGKEGEPMNIPAPPTLNRIAAMMGGSAEDVDDVGGSEVDWPSSMSQFMEEYQTAITESLRNLSIDEISGLAQNGEQEKSAPEFGKDTMVSPGVPLSPPGLAKLDEKFSNEEYDSLMQEMTFGACLQMPELDHPPIMTTRSNSTAQHRNNAKDYGKGVAGVLQYDAGMEFQYHSTSDEQYYSRGPDPEHQDRAVFAKQLSEKLLNLGGVNSSMNSASVEDREASPQKLSHEASFDSKDSNFMSPPKRGGDANKDVMTDKFHPGLFVSNMPRNGDLPYSGQPSVSSNSIVTSPDRGTPSRQSQGKAADAPSTNSAGESIADFKPTMVESIDNETGIPKGDVMLSLLCDNSFQASVEKPDSWAWRVQEGIWRGREMRRDRDQTLRSRSNSEDGGEMSAPQSRRSSLPVDVDDVRVVGGINNLSSIQDKALAHLERDEFEQALELFEDIVFGYYSFFEAVIQKRDEYSSKNVSVELSNFKPYIGASLHNLGVIHLLKGDYEDAFSFFKRAVDNRRACLGEAHPDCVTSMIRLATCRFAMDNFADAHTNLELSLALAGSKARTTSDYSQLGEILNNLGCLSYMCGQPTKAMKLFRESLDVQLAVLNSTLYGGSKYSAHSATLNLSVTRGNIGFLALVLRDVSSGILALEAALREQRLLLNGAHVTLVSTMDHLAVANLLDGRTHKALKMLRRIYELQRAAHGPNDQRCLATRQKILTIRGQQLVQENERDTPNNNPRQQRPSSFRHEEEAKSARSVAEQEPYGQQPEANVERKQIDPPAGEVTSSSRSAAMPNSNLSNNGSSGGKVNSVFKAIRSLGRKKN